MLLVRRSVDAKLLSRMDPGYWHPAYDKIIEASQAPLARLGDFIELITYGPIVTGRRPPQTDTGLVVIHQGQVGATGVDPTGAIRVAPGSPWDRENARLRWGDIVLPRSGVASVAKNRVAVFLGDYEAVVGSFVDLVRLDGIDPVYGLLCVKTQLVWSQIHRIINGVGTPNISFDEVRSLLVPVLPERLQLDFRSKYLQNVHPLHLAGLGGEEASAAQAAQNMGHLITRLDALVCGATDAQEDTTND